MDVILFFIFSKPKGDNNRNARKFELASVRVSLNCIIALFYRLCILAKKKPQSKLLWG